MMFCKWLVSSFTPDGKARHHVINFRWDVAGYIDEERRKGNRIQLFGYNPAHCLGEVVWEPIA